MPVHDWKRVSTGVLHDFYCGWITHLKETLNDGLLPEDFYALNEQPAGIPGTDVHLAMETDTERFSRKQRHVVIRRSRDDRILAVIELVAPGNKNSLNGVRAFVDKVLDALTAKINLLIIDLLQPGPYDPQGIHGAIWEEIDGGQPYAQPTGKRLTLAAYHCGRETAAYIEPVAVGDELSDMPLFFDADSYVSVPLERTYQQAYQGVPRRWRQVLEAPAS